MKKHKRRETISEIADKYFNDIKLYCGDSLRFYSILSNLCNEYFINEIICEIFNKPEKIIDATRDLGTFTNKLILLDACGIFETQGTLYNNLEELNGIRNIYAHRLIKEEIPQNVKDKITNLWNQYKKNYSKHKNFTFFEKFKIIEDKTFYKLISLWMSVKI